jgi:hypothetical protein
MESESVLVLLERRPETYHCNVLSSVSALRLSIIRHLCISLLHIRAFRSYFALPIPCLTDMIIGTVISPFFFLIS